MMCGLHLYMGYTQPLFVQGIMGIKNLYDAKPVALYILGKKAEGDLKRPFKAAGMFGGQSPISLPRMFSLLMVFVVFSCPRRTRHRCCRHHRGREARWWCQGGVNVYLSFITGVRLCSVKMGRILS